MTLLSFHYPNFQISSSWAIPSHLQDLLHDVWLYHYEELYEENVDGTTPLEDAIEAVLDALANENYVLTHSRYVFMALILALAVEPTVETYFPQDTRPRKVLLLIANWYCQVIQSVKWNEYPHNRVIQLSAQEQLIGEAEIANGKDLELLSAWITGLSSTNNKASVVLKINNQLFPRQSEGTQAIDEALDVFRNGVRILDINQARLALLEMLDDCLEGYAVFPGSQGRRDLFNWWLLEVVPATWCLQLPKFVYTINGLKPLNPHQFFSQTIPFSY